jgi:hypothetical protein
LSIAARGILSRPLDLFFATNMKSTLRQRRR